MKMKYVIGVLIVFASMSTLYGSSKEQLQVFVRNLDGRKLTVNLPLDATVLTLKQRLEKITGVPVSQMRILFNFEQKDQDSGIAGGEWADDRRLDTWEIPKADIVMMRRLKQPSAAGAAFAQARSIKYFDEKKDYIPVNVYVDPNESFGSFRQQVAKISKVSVEEQHMVSHGRALRDYIPDSKKISDIPEFFKWDVIHVLRRRPGQVPAKAAVKGETPLERIAHALNRDSNDTEGMLKAITTIRNQVKSIYDDQVRIGKALGTGANADAILKAIQVLQDQNAAFKAQFEAYGAPAGQ